MIARFPSMPDRELQLLMQGAAWINLLHRIPANLHDGVAIGLVTGAEIVVQQIIKLEEEFVILRGRMSGSTAEARLMIVPYAHMTLVGISRRISEAESQAILGTGAPTAFAVVEAAKAEPAVALPAPAPEVAPAAARPADSKSDQSKPPPSKSILLARLRERLAEKGK